jgi:hypothetical protein
MLQARKEIWPSEYSCVVGLAVIQCPTNAEPKRFPAILFLSLLVAVRPVATKKSVPQKVSQESSQVILDDFYVVKTIINHPMFDGLYHP